MKHSDQCHSEGGGCWAWGGAKMTILGALNSKRETSYDKKVALTEKNVNG